MPAGRARGTRLCRRQNSYIAAPFKSRRGLKQFRPLHSLPIKKAPVWVLFNWRRGRDLNPRNLAVYRFSRPAVSTTHTPLQLHRCRVAGAGIYSHYSKLSLQPSRAQKRPNRSWVFSTLQSLTGCQFFATPTGKIVGCLASQLSV